MQTIFDSHAHYDDEAFDNDRDELLIHLNESGVCGIVNNATDIKTSRFNVEFVKKYPFIYGTAGIHPECASNIHEEDYKELREILKEEKIVAVGEIGLDYYWKDVPKEEQLIVFERQLQLALEVDMPVIIHDREAHGDTFLLLSKYKPKGFLHSFSGSVEMMREAVKLGLSISLGGVVTFKNARHSVDVAREVPIDRLLLETDAPYLSPVPFRGKRCDSSMIRYTAEKIAEIRQTSTDEIIRQTRENAKKMFGI
ncbi:MAG: TatD family hydrolase [Bacillota bacterium]|nr:TatD family hydrolase [Bacillota bacterium]